MASPGGAHDCPGLCRHHRPAPPPCQNCCSELRKSAQANSGNPPNFLLGSSKSSLPLPNQRLSLSPPHTAPVPHPWICKSLRLRWQLSHRLQRGTSSPQHVHQLQEFSNWTTHGKFDRDSELRGGVESGTLWGGSSVSPALRQLDPPLQPRC